MLYIKNCLTDFDEIWTADALWPSEFYGPEKEINTENENCHLPFLNFQ